VTILLATGEPSFSRSFLQALLAEGLPVSPQMVRQRYDLMDLVDVVKPRMLVLHDVLLKSYLYSRVEKDYEILYLIRQINLKYKYAIQMIYICQREPYDIFLFHLRQENVLDIINEQNFIAESLINRLKAVAARFDSKAATIPV
jgi:hypothetical protein